MIKIKSLENTPADELFIAFNKAFTDYERQWNYEEFLKMLIRRGFRSDISFGAFDKDELVSFTLNGFGKFNGIQSAYDTGTGTILDYRGKGLATDIFYHSMPFLKSHSVDQYVLEVLQHNEKAISVYKKIGFKIGRELNYFISEKESLKINLKPTEFEFREMDFSYLNEMQSLCSFNPSWQNTFTSIERCKSDFEFIGAFAQDKLIGFGIVEPTSGDIPQFAVRDSFQRKGIGTHIFGELVKRILHSNVKIINTPKEDYRLTEFLSSMNFHPSGSQYEMILEF
jgi:ribosomal protein S18 acetylase RimI-like enzyme